jgi:DNA-directed RNA polymerase beta subunit
MGNSVVYPEFNQFPRNLFSCGQSKQAVSMFHTNAQLRMDRSGIVLNYGQTPLVKSRYLEYMTKEQHPYGVNAIVAIMSYTGYNVEDAILINEGAIQRGMFNTTYYTSYVAYEKSSQIGDNRLNSVFTNMHDKNVKISERSDYSNLDENGLIRENTYINIKQY